MEDIIIRIILGLITPVIQFIVTKLLNPLQAKINILEIRKPTNLKRNKNNKFKTRNKPAQILFKQKNKYLSTK